HSPSRIGLNDVDELPRNAPGRNLPEQNMQGRSRRYSTQQTPDGSARSHIDRMDAQYRGLDGMRTVDFLSLAVSIAVGFFSGCVHLKFDIVDAYHFASIDI